MGYKTARTQKTGRHFLPTFIKTGRQSLPTFAITGRQLLPTFIKTGRIFLPVLLDLKIFRAILSERR